MLAVVAYFGILGAFTAIALVLYFSFRALKLI
ncbi:MAG: cytochrome b6-f complex subunit PetL [Cyanobacteriota bacterium]|nr:cytochrome b6-f complex subunit PetL [Cyanobacteriota bacterium]